jgi:hypothetical protein
VVLRLNAPKPRSRSTPGAGAGYRSRPIAVLPVVLAPDRPLRLDEEPLRAAVCLDGPAAERRVAARDQLRSRTVGPVGSIPTRLVPLPVTHVPDVSV